MTTKKTAPVSIDVALPAIPTKLPAKLTVKYAKSMIGPLSKPSKMPGLGYGLPAKACHVGSVLRSIPGSTCEGCYAMKGNYIYDNVQQSQYKRLESITRSDWVTLIVFLIGKQLKADTKGRKIRGKVYRKFFRWHDSGDLQSVDHLRKIVEVCEATPDVAHWLPTREKQIVLTYLREHGELPRNLTLRASATMIDGEIPVWFKLSSTVHRGKGTRDDECQAYTREGTCGSCRLCWTDAANVSYPKH